MDKGRKIRAIIYGTLALAVLVFIFSNSAAPAAISKKQSGRLVEFLRPFLTNVLHIPEKYHVFAVRKTAHFAEFGALGTFLMACAVNLDKKIFRIAAFEVCVVAAFCDEAIQIFAENRGPGIRDVLIDSAGAACGVLFVLIIRKLFGRKKPCQN